MASNRWGEYVVNEPIPATLYVDIRLARHVASRYWIAARLIGLAAMITNCDVEMKVTQGEQERNR